MTEAEMTEAEMTEERLARAALSRVAEPGDAGLNREIAARGAAAVWERLRREHPDVEPERDLDNVVRLGGRFVCPGDREWPAALDGLQGASRVAGAPFGLWVGGPASLVDAAERAVAVVGSRAASSYGLHVAGEIALDLAAAGWTVVSGAAYGIDGAAHRGALAAGGPTVAVLAGGIDVPYPRQHETLLRRMWAERLVLSEAPPGTPPLRRRFLDRNRIIAALAAGSLVVEAGVRSGALSTMRHARRLGRHVMAVPGPVTSGLSAGCHLLLRQWPESVLVTSGAEVIEVVGRVGELSELPLGAPDVRDDLDGFTRRLLDTLPSRRPATAAVLAERCGATERGVELVLQALLANGLVERRPDGYRLTDLGRRPSGQKEEGVHASHS